MRTNLILTGVTWTWLAASCWSAPVLTLAPSAAISGAPGATIGWGFDILNDTAGYLVVSNVTPSGFSAAVGSFSDFIAALNFYIVNPNSSLSVAFDNGTQQGFGSFAINPAAINGSSTSGIFTVFYDLYVNDPNVDPSQVTPGQQFDPITASVSVGGVDVPEPATAFLTSAALALLAVPSLRRKPGSP